jgi:hypothetical protein
MAQTGYTPIQLYYSSTATNVPLAASLANGELAINITDGKLFYKDNAAAVQVIGWKTTPTSAGGTGLTSYTVGDLTYYASGTAFTKLGIGTAYQALQVNAGATAPSWQPSASSVLTAQGDLLYASGANTLARLAKDTNATRYLSNTGTTNNPAWAQISLTAGVSGILPVANGGTNVSSASITAFNNITGYSASGATGTTTTNLVFSTSPSITTPTLVGDVTVSTGNVVIGTSGKGIDFSATPGTGTSELLADYEEGTWTPTVQGAGTAGTYTLSGITAKYTKVGSQVTVWAQFGFSAASGGTNYCRIGGLPFTYAAGAGVFGALRTDSFDFTTATPASLVMAAATGGSGTTLNILELRDALGPLDAPIAGVSTSTLIGFTITYMV